MRHRSRLAALLAANPDVRPLVVSSLVEALRQQERLDEVKAEFRKATPGMLTADEMTRLSGSPMRRAAQELSAEMVRQQKATPRSGDGVADP